MGDSSQNGFNERERAFEAKYLHDEEITFKINARRNRLFGLWAAHLLGYTGEKIDAYVDEVIIADLQKNKGKGVFHKVFGDLKAAKVQISEHRAQGEFEKCWEEAKEKIMNDLEE